MTSDLTTPTVTHSTSTSAAIILALAAAAPAAAQAPATTLTPGTRVRVESPVLGARAVVRRVAVQRGDTLVLARDQRAGRDSVVLALADVRTIEVSRGWRQRAITGGLVGLVGGTAAGAVIGYNSPMAAEPCGRDCTRAEVTRKQGALMLAPTGAQAGAALGALFGRFVLGERWERLAPGGQRVGGGPIGPSGVWLAVTFR